MKKISVGIFTVLTIVFAATSAFTSNRIKGATTWEAYYVDQDALSSTTPGNGPADQNRIGDPLHVASAPFNLNNYGTCTLDNDHICVVEIKYQDGVPASGGVEDFKPGDNPF